MASEQSFLDRVQRSGELETAVKTLAPPYAPADSKFSIAKLTAGIAAATAAHAAVATKRLPFTDATSDRAALAKTISPLVTQALADAIADRHQAALGPAGLKAVFDGVKTSVKGQYGQTSRQYTTVSGIKW